MTASAPSSRRLWKRVAIGFAVGFVLLAANLPPWGLHRERNSFKCATCLSREDVFQWRIGDWGEFSLPLSPKTIVIHESKTFRRFTPQPHDHDWRFAQGSPYYCFGIVWGGCALGEGRHCNDLGTLVEGPWSNADAFLESKLKSGELTTNRLYEALISPRIRPQATNLPTASQKLATELADEFLARPVSPGD